jgi:hypothetical protein
VLTAIASKKITIVAFLPRSRSKIVFVIAMACYAFYAGVLMQAIATAFGTPYPGVSTFAHHHPIIYIIEDLLFAPVLESLELIVVIELLRWIRSPIWLQVLGSAVFAASLHALVSVSLAFVVAPGWVIMAIAYLTWRRASWKTGFVVIASIHTLLNLAPALWTLGYFARHT